jgi:FAD:protein FMN transferase
MFGIQRRKGQIWFAIISSLFLLASCRTVSTPQEQLGGEIIGNTQGTTYNIIIANEKINFTKAEIDSILHDFDLALSTYHDNSAITLLNNTKVSASAHDPFGYLSSCYKQSKEVYQLTGGAFDPSVFPLVKGWGFMENVDEPMSDEDIIEVMDYVGFDNYHAISFRDDSVLLSKEKPEFKLDFNAIAQGYSVDVIDEFLKSRGQENYYVEIGGEIIVRGKNRDGDRWRIGIDAPKDDNTTHELENIIHVSDVCIATSGNYRKFYEKDGVKYAHTLDPKTGYPVTHSLLSVTVIAESCAEADAYATAFMVMGAEITLAFVDAHPELKLKVYLLESGTEDEIISSSNDAFSQYLVE